MALKTFNVSGETYGKFSRFCRENGISMSKQVENFMAAFLEDEPEARKSYLKRLERIRKGKFIKVRSFAERYGV